VTITGAAHVDILRRGDPVQQLKEDTSDVTCIYIGMTPKMATGINEPKWQIKRVENKDGVVTTLFANDAKYNAVWNLRASYFPPCEGNTPIAGVTDTNVVTTPTIAWIDFLAQNVEYSYAMPAGTKRFLLQNVGSREIQASYTAGDSGIAGNWYPIGASTSHFEEEIGADQTIYTRITSNIAGIQRLIILSWK